jgi:hypothetical protein
MNGRWELLASDNMEDSLTVVIGSDLDRTIQMDDFPKMDMRFNLRGGGFDGLYEVIQTEFVAFRGDDVPWVIVRRINEIDDLHLIYLVATVDS